MNRGDASVSFEANAATVAGFARDGNAPRSKGCQIAEQCAPTDSELVRELRDRRGVATPQKISQLHESFGAWHEVTDSVIEEGRRERPRPIVSTPSGHERLDNGRNGAAKQRRGTIPARRPPDAIRWTGGGGGLTRWRADRNSLVGCPKAVSSRVCERLATCRRPKKET